MIRLTITDISDIHNPLELGYIEEYTTSVAWGLSVKNHYAYMADMYSGLRIYDISQPDSISLVSQFDLPGQLWDVYAGNYFAITLSDEPSLQLVNINDRQNPFFVMSLPLAGIANEIGVSFPYVCIADDSLLQIFRLPDPDCYYVPGDANGNGVFTGTDVTYIVNWLKGGPLPPPIVFLCPPNEHFYAGADANGSCSVNGLDTTYMVRCLKDGIVPLFCQVCPPSF